MVESAKETRNYETVYEKMDKSEEMEKQTPASIKESCFLTEIEDKEVDAWFEAIKACALFHDGDYSRSCIRNLKSDVTLFRNDMKRFNRTFFRLSDDGTVIPNDKLEMFMQRAAAFVRERGYHVKEHKTSFACAMYLIYFVQTRTGTSKKCS
jgi:hypothetical protein